MQREHRGMVGSRQHSPCHSSLCCGFCATAAKKVRSKSSCSCVRLTVRAPLTITMISAEGVQSNIDCCVDWRAIKRARGRGEHCGCSRPTAKWDACYSSWRWARIRRHQLLKQPFCCYCPQRGIVTAAEICDHVEPHRGGINKFWHGPFMSLCKRCHNSSKRLVERRGFRPDVGVDGWPVDPHHPVHTQRR